MRVVHFDSLESTNKYCEALDLAQVEDFTCFWADEQTAGIGQRGNHWHSAPGENLTFSLVVKPAFLPSSRQFLLTQALSLAIVDCLAPFHLPESPSIKWPNDIYVGGCKICGTLVSAALQGDAMSSAVCGIGLNVNQSRFPDWVPNPTSLSLLTGTRYDLEPLLNRMLVCIEARYAALKAGTDPKPDYMASLLNLGKWARYAFHGREVRARIDDVDSYGRLLLTTDDSGRLCCGLKEIALLPALL